MKVSKDACDQCGKETNDYYSQIGWIRIESSNGGNISVTKGRKSDRTAECSVFKKFPINDHLDFCCMDCLVKWLTPPKPVKKKIERKK